MTYYFCFIFCLLAETLAVVYNTFFKKNFLLLGSSIERLCEIAVTDPLGYPPPEGPLGDRGAMVRAARALLSSVTRVLLLADIVVVKQLLLAKDKVSFVLNVTLHS